MTPDQLSFLRAILTEPREDTHRLAFADWLDENGQADRAEFIRVQINLTHEQCAADVKRGSKRLVAPYCYGCRRVEDLIRRELGLSARLPPFLPRDCGAYETTGEDFGNAAFAARVRRGFVAEIACPAADWLKHHEALYWHPEQTVVCENCNGHGEFTRANSDGPPGPCPDCGGQWEPRDDESDKGWSEGTGRVPRPFVPTAQPIEIVRLDRNPVEWFDSDMQMVYIPGLPREFDTDELTGAESFAHGALNKVWPGIKFILPAPTSDAATS